MKCPSCRTNDAQYDPIYHYLPCKDCQTTTSTPKATEIIPNRLKEDRKAYHDYTIQPFREGRLSKEYVDKYGTKHIKVTEKEVKNARRVWDGYYND